MEWLYLISLVVSIGCLALLDWRYKLAFWYNRRRALITLSVGVFVFIIWDLLGIRFGIFFHGNSQFSLPIRLLPEFPIEEIFFLILLCYCTLLVYRGAQKI